MAGWHNTQDWQKARAYAKTVLDPECVLCGTELSGGDWTIAHILPPSVTGEPNHDIGNLQLLCRVCNGRKADKSAVRAAWKSSKW